LLKHPTLDQLNALGLHGMAKAFVEIAANGQADGLGHHEWLGLLLDREASWRQDKRFAARLRVAKLRQQASVEDVDYRSPRGLDRALFQKLVDWAADLKRRGVYAGVEALAQGGKTVRRKGAGLVIDGPYAEGREAVLGFFFVRVADVDEACAIAAESPHAEIGGATEVRMLGTFPKP